MLNDGKIEPAQFRKLVVLYVLGRSLLINPSLLTPDAKQDAWIASIGGLAIGLFLVWIYAKIGSMFPEMTLAEIIQELLGSWLGKIAVLLFSVNAFLYCAILARSLGIFLITTMMPETPIEWTMGMFLFIAATGVRNGLENIARTADILFPWVIMFFLILVVLIMPEVEADKIQPVMGEGLKPLLRGIYQQIGFPYLDLVLLLMFYPFVNKTREAGKAFMQGTLLGGIALVIVTTLSILVLGAEETANELYPSFGLAKEIEIANFITRVEAIMALIWFITIYFKITMSLHVSTLSFTQLFKLTDYRPFVLPMGFILLGLSQIIAPNVSFLSAFESETRTAYALSFGFLLPVILLIAAAVRRRHLSRT